MYFLPVFRMDESKDVDEMQLAKPENVLMAKNENTKRRFPSQVFPFHSHCLLSQHSNLRQMYIARCWSQP